MGLEQGVYRNCTWSLISFGTIEFNTFMFGQVSKKSLGEYQSSENIQVEYWDLS